MSINVLRGSGFRKKLLGSAPTLEGARRAWFGNGAVNQPRGPNFQHPGVFGPADHESDGIFTPATPQGVNFQKNAKFFKKFYFLANSLIVPIGRRI